MRLKNKTALVSGVGKGMGSAMALLFAQEGADVVLFARKPDVIEPLAAKIRGLGRRAEAITGDATIGDDIKAAADRAAQMTGRLDVFASLPGGGFRHTNDVVDMESSFFQMMLNNHLVSLFHGVGAVVPHMKTNGGSIITIAASYTVLRDGNVAYSTVKEGVIGFSKNLARELHQHNIRVNIVAPGLIRIPIQTKAIELPRSELGRRGQPEDVAYAALYFASDESRWITGQVLAVDGGGDVFADRERVFD